MTIGLGLGISRFPFESARGYWRWVEQCEAGNVNSIWQTDRLVSKEPMLESLSTMAAIAGATEKIRFGMNVASIALRDPLLTAKQCATIDGGIVHADWFPEQRRCRVGIARGVSHFATVGQEDHLVVTSKLIPLVPYAGKNGREPVVVVLRDRLERMIVALGTLNPRAHEDLNCRFNCVFRVT